jgi:hypothetical protein
MYGSFSDMVSFLDDPIVLNVEDLDSDAEALYTGLSMDYDEEAPYSGQDKNYECFSLPLAASPLDTLDKVTAVDDSPQSEVEYEGKCN